MKLWFQEWKDTHMIRDLVIEVTEDDTRTHKIFHGIDEMCTKLDLSHPIWLDANIREFQRRSKTRFTSDNFQDEIPFDYLQIQILEE